jgi:outer membrane protein assembly factor BamE
MVRVISVVAVLASVIAGCTSIPGITPYKIEIQQGNFVSQEMVSQLKPGMSQEQVRFTLGTPLLTDIFHADRWDYVYWRETADGKREQRKLAVFFEGGKLVRVDGDVVAARAAK